MPLLYGALGVIGLGAAVVVALASRKPSSFRIERKKLIAAKPDVIFPKLEDLHRWTEWSPWEKLDPALQRTYGGSERGVGATYAWKGNNKAGEGRMEIVESQPSERVALKLQFIKPFPATNTTVFTLTPSGEGTEVSWTMEGENTFMGKLFSVFADMDAMIGKDFDEGLANLERAATNR
ncbi:SRPBCC family protein [Sandaracinus amylolyticus]|uniref:SRPBCC family protein n=1 Tax=Sandaracinus amylolyticus TaxID=927083 RepID=UPI00069DAC46|nr:SRPBCC family protein [Sandaracinus amylolyticus]